MRVFKPGNTPKTKLPTASRRRRRIKWRITCQHCGCEFGVTDDELEGAAQIAESRAWYDGPCPDCGKTTMYDGRIRVNEKGEPLRGART